MDERRVRLKQGLLQLTNDQLKTVLNYEFPMCLDTYQYDKGTGYY